MLLSMVALCARMIFEKDATVGFNSIEIEKKLIPTK